MVEIEGEELTNVQIRKCKITDFDAVIKCLDDNLSAEGFGFVNKMQVQTEVNRGTVWVADKDGQVVGVRVGKLTLWNIVVDKDYRKYGIGRKLMEVYMPNTIRVKNEPIGHLSTKQKNNFTDPTPFYEKMGYTFWGKDFGRNFWAGGTKDKKRIFTEKGKSAHISIFKRIQNLLFK